MDAPTRPVLRYHGGKWIIAPWIIEHFPAHRVYVEPFGGAASVLLRKSRSYAEVYNDLGDDVVNLFRVLRDKSQADRLQKQLELTPFARAEFVNAYEPTTDAIEAARRFMVRCSMGFGTSGQRKTKTGFRSRPVRPGGKQTVVADWVNLPASIPLITSRLRGVLIEHRPAIDLIHMHDAPDTLFYVDPPYVLSTRTSLTGGATPYAHEMSDEDHAQLAEVLHQTQGHVVLSGYDCPLYRELYSSWTMFTHMTNASSRDGSARRTECLWLSPSAYSASRGTLADMCVSSAARPGLLGVMA